MHRRLLLLWTLCALAAALPQDKISVETESEELKNGVTRHSIVIEDISALFTTTSSTASPPVTTTTDSATSTNLAQSGIQDLVQEGGTAPTAPPVSASDVTSTTAKPESKVINIKHAADLTNEVSKAGDKLVVIFVMTTWCGFSRQLEPAVEDVARSTENIIVLKIVYNKIDTTEDWKYGVFNMDSYPGLFFLKKGKKLDQYVGGGAELLKTKVNENMIIHIE